MPASQLDLSDPSPRASRVALRRGLGLVFLTLLLPGSAQLQAGSKTVGRVAMRIWMGLVGLVVLLVLLGLLWRGAAVTILASGSFYKLLAPLVITLGLGMAYLLLDAWRLAQPLRMERRARLGFGLGAVLLAAAVMLLSLNLGQAARAQGNLLEKVLAGGGTSKSHSGRYNILMLGADAGDGRVGLRPDSITVASVAEDTGRTVMFSLPRNLEGVRFPENSPLHKLYPQGYDCPDHSCMLNAVYTLGQDHKDLYPNAPDPGLQAMKEAVSETLGLPINYTVMVDLKGFIAVIDAVGGITLDINKRVPIGGGTSRINGWIEPGKDVKLDGYHALWFARSRHGSTDFERMLRQKCVINAMVNQLDPITVMGKFTKIAEAGEQVAYTDVPSKDVNRLGTLAGKTRKLPIMSVSFTPPLVYPGNPKWDVIRRTVEQKIAASEALDDGGGTPKKAAKAAAQSKAPVPTSPMSKAPGTPAVSATPSQEPTNEGTPKPDNEDLEQVCSA